MTYSKENTIGEIVAHDYRTADVFKAHNIDFCCQGNRSLNEACQNQNIDLENVIQELNLTLGTTENQNINFQDWDLDLLADYIQKKHHRYVAKKIPEINEYLTKIVKVHGARHPELMKISKLFLDSAHELMAHMESEEQILFPYIHQLVSIQNTPKLAFGSIQNPIDQMMKEHDNEGHRFREIESLSNHYQAPADACATFTLTYALLKEFQDDLHLHIHLENNILFPKAINLEKTQFHA